MPIAVVCSHCDKKLKVADTAAGKKIRCPACQGTIAVAEAAPPTEEEVGPATDADEGAYGLDEEQAEDEEERRRQRKRDLKRRDKDEKERRRRARKPHRGGLILALGILSIVFSCAFVICWYLAWRAINMAGEDLDAMSSQRMDPAGAGMTQGGKICGIIGAILGFVVLIVAVGLKVATM